MEKVLILNRLKWYTRIPAKWAVFGLVFLVVCFPYPNLLVRHVRHWQDPNALIEPDAKALAPLIKELEPMMSDTMPSQEALRTVENFVYEKLPYDWDWNVWGNADYLPTVTEALEKGREDCDGRAVVAASLLKRFGFEVQIVTDFAHVWVKTDRGETMGPGKRKAVVATDKGLQLRFDALQALPKAMAYSIAPFPLSRELVLLAVAWLLLLRVGGGKACNLVALLLLLDGLMLLRIGGKDFRSPIVWMQVLGLLNWIAVLICMFVWAGRNARRVGACTAVGTQT